MTSENNDVHGIILTDFVWNQRTDYAVRCDSLVTVTKPPYTKKAVASEGNCEREFYLRESEKKNWQDARDACMAIGMDLASINSAE